MNLPRSVAALRLLLFLFAGTLWASPEPAVLYDVGAVALTPALPPLEH